MTKTTTPHALIPLNTLTPLVPAAEIAYGRDFPGSNTLRALPDLPVIRVATLDVFSEEFSLAMNDVSVGTGSITVPGGYLGTMRIQIGRHQAYLVVNPRDAEFRAMLCAWRAAGKIGVVWDLADRAATLVTDFDSTMGRRLDDVASQSQLSVSSFVSHAFGYIASGILETQATSDIARFPKLATAHAFLLATESVSKEADVLTARLMLEAERGRRLHTM